MLTLSLARSGRAEVMVAGVKQPAPPAPLMGVSVPVPRVSRLLVGVWGWICVWGGGGVVFSESPRECGGQKFLLLFLVCGSCACLLGVRGRAGLVWVFVLFVWFIPGEFAELTKR
ncbi:hypothetical protein KIH31_18000, partial [Paenarthrobacter sp. DKR-5]|uniref:hypothetical protein n=1 Tax=Paenarthrobacter sp. DKR-5 TaxID=2835535 RepID=UPI001BDC470F